MKLYGLILCLIISTASYSEILSQRKCMLLPITDSLDGVLGHKVFNHVERFIKDSTWCYYRSNSGIINILQNYRRDLRSHLNDKQVINAISQKVRAGSLIKIDLKSQVKGIELDLIVLGPTGDDIYFKEKTLVESDDPFILAQTINNWLNLYDKTIPYDGHVIGVLGDQFTIDMGRASLVRVSQGIKVVSPTEKKKHPLLKQVVEWDTELIARAKIFNTSEFQARAKVTTYHAQRKINVGDWVRVDKDQVAPIVEKSDFPEIDKDNFGKLGIVSLKLEAGSGSVSTLVSNSNKQIGGMEFGFHVATEIFATRNFWGSLELGRRFATYKQKEGTLTQDSNNVTAGAFKIKAGYKYLPLGFFYGPQVDGYIGYAKYSYNLDTQPSDGFGDASIAGLLFGVRGDIPVHRMFRIFARLEYMPAPGYDEKTVVLGEGDSANGLEFEIGTHYIYSTGISIDGSLQMTANKAKFSSTNEISYKDTLLRLGASFSF